jgi:hypothetical protein
MKPTEKRDLEVASLEALRYQITDIAFATRNWGGLEKKCNVLPCPGCTSKCTPCKEVKPVFAKGTITQIYMNKSGQRKFTLRQLDALMKVLKMVS